MKLNLFSKGETNAKQRKDAGTKSYILYMAPSDSAVRGTNLCPSTVVDKSCVSSCLFYCGRGAFPTVYNSRLAKSLMFINGRERFEAFYTADLYNIDDVGKQLGTKVVARSNGTSDLNFFKTFGLHASYFPNTIHHEYTKVFGYLHSDTGVHYTFSASETNIYQQIEALYNGFGVAKVYHGELPESDFIGGKEYRVIDGDLSDLRHLDKVVHGISHTDGYIVGLRFKKPRFGIAKLDKR